MYRTGHVYRASWVKSENIFVLNLRNSKLKTQIMHTKALFDLILYDPSNIFQLCREGFSWVGPVLS